VLGLCRPESDGAALGRLSHLVRGPIPTRDSWGPRDFRRLGGWWPAGRFMVRWDIVDPTGSVGGSYGQEGDLAGRFEVELSARRYRGL
jgi:hypothetical protein